MPRFYFHIHDGVRISDSEGTDLLDRQEAETEAVRLAGALIAENAEAVAARKQWSMDVTDQAGFVLFRLIFEMNGAAAAPG